MIGPAHIGALAALRDHGGPGPLPGDWWDTLQLPSFNSESSGLSNRTVRNFFYAGAAAGLAFRVAYRASNKNDLVIGRAFVGVRGAANSSFASTPHQVLFGGNAGVTIPAGTTLLSDPVIFTLVAADQLQVSTYIQSGHWVDGRNHEGALYVNSPYQYASGDVADSLAPSMIQSLSPYLPILSWIETRQDDPAWSDAWAPVSNITPSSWSGYTLRIVINKSNFPMGINAIQAWIGNRSGSSAHTFKGFIGHSAGSPAYGFAATPVPIEFGGLGAASLGAQQFLKSDDVLFSPNGTDDVVVSFYLTSTGSGRPVGFTNPSGFQTYYRSGDYADSMSPGSMSTYGDFPALCRLRYR